jgi:mannosyltransferase OCH1-like enzyme
MITIPKTLHYVWMGPKPLHPIMQRWQDGWRTLHPQWTIKVWRDDPELPETILRCDSEMIECRHPEYLKHCRTYAKRSDVWRYEILEQHGGVYLDTDFEPLKCIDPLLENIGTFAGLCNTRYDWSDADPIGKIKTEVGCSILGCTPHHPWLFDLVRGIPGQDIVAQLSLAFPYLTGITGKHPEVKLYPVETFYAVPWDQYALGGRRALRKAPPPPGAYAMHQWSSAWYEEGLKPRFNLPQSS